MRYPALACALALLVIRPAAAQEIRAFWVDGFNEGCKTREQTETLLRRLRQANCNAVFVQMRKSADAYYQSRYDPWAADDPARFDALAYLIERAHAQTPAIQVHAWLNTCAVGRSHGNPRHIARLHPEWLSLSDKGADYDQEATKIDPGNPDAADWTVRVYLDVLRHYDVDGVALDFVRYGGAAWGYNPMSVARFNARFRRSGAPRPDDPAWKQWRRDQVTALVRRVYALAAGVRPRAVISAATITWGKGPLNSADWNERSAPMNRVFQDWRAWMREGIIDLNCLMSYYSDKRHPDWFRAWIDWAKANQFERWAAPSSGIWLNPIPASLAQIDAIRRPTASGARAHGVMLYSYCGTDSSRDGSEHTYNEALYEALSHTPSDAGAPPFAAPSAFPEMPWKIRPAAGIVKGCVLAAESLHPADGAVVTLSGPSLRRPLAQRTDGGGFYAFVGTPPGAYRLCVTARGGLPVERPVRVSAGSVASDTILLGEASSPQASELRFPDITTLPAGTPIRLRRAAVIAGSDHFPGRAFVTEVGAPRTTLHVRLPVADALPLQAGDIIALSGVVANDLGEAVVAASTARLVDMQMPPPDPPVIATSDRPGEPGGRLVRLSGRVVEASQERCRIDAPNGPVEVLLVGSKLPGTEDMEAPIPAPPIGATVEVAGVAVPLRDPRGVLLTRLRPRTPEDLRVLPRLSVWRALAWASGPAAVGAIYAAWAIRRRTRKVAHDLPPI